MADVFQETIDLAELLIIGALAYFAYKAYRFLTNQGGTNCGPNGGQPCCKVSEVGTDTCVGSDGSPCGSWEFWTATSCYEGTPTTTSTQIKAAQSDSSAVAGFGSLFTNPQFTGSFDINAPTPGLPAGYNPATGTIDTPQPSGFLPGPCPEGALC